MSKIWKVGACDGLASQVAEKFHSDAQFDFTDLKNEEKTVELLSTYDFLILRSATQIKEDFLTQLPNLKGIIRAGVGVDNIDLNQSSALGVAVWNAPSGNFQSAAEHSIALMMSMMRNSPQSSSDARILKWSKKEWASSGRMIQGKTLGLVGLGNIGQRVARIAQALEMSVQFFDPVVESFAGAKKLSFEEVIKSSDVISIHVPLIEATKNLFTDQEFSSMKSDAFLINVSRGGIVCEKSLLAALMEGQISGAAFDVFESEPFDKGDTDFYERLLAHPRFIGTPHLGASTQEGQLAVAEECYSKLKRALNGSSAEDWPKTLNNLEICRLDS